jgi:hypothetical protein
VDHKNLMSGRAGSAGGTGARASGPCRWSDGRGDAAHGRLRGPPPADEREGIPGLLSAASGSRQPFGQAAAPFAALQRSLDAALDDRALEPGEICFTGNFQAVHGRKPFKAR